LDKRLGGPLDVETKRKIHTFFRNRTLVVKTVVTIPELHNPFLSKAHIAKLAFVPGPHNEAFTKVTELLLVISTNFIEKVDY
jgi:hypothetical protein